MHFLCYTLNGCRHLGLWVSFGMPICVCVVPANGVSSLHWLLLWSTWHTPTVLLTGPDRSASCRSRRGKHTKMSLKLWWVGRSLLVSPWDPYISQMSYEQGKNLSILGIASQEYTNIYSLHYFVWKITIWEDEVWVIEKDQFVQSGAGDKKGMRYIIYAFTTHTHTANLFVYVLASMCVCVCNVLYVCTYVLAFLMFCVCACVCACILYSLSPRLWCALPELKG